MFDGPDEHGCRSPLPGHLHLLQDDGPLVTAQNIQAFIGNPPDLPRRTIVGSVEKPGTPYPHFPPFDEGEGPGIWVGLGANEVEKDPLDLAHGHPCPLPSRQAENVVTPAPAPRTVREWY